MILPGYSLLEELQGLSPPDPTASGKSMNYSIWHAGAPEYRTLLSYLFNWLQFFPPIWLIRMRHFWRKALSRAFGNCLWFGSENERRGNSLGRELLRRFSRWAGLHEGGASEEGSGAREKQLSNLRGWGCVKGLLQKPGEILKPTISKKTLQSNHHAKNWGRVQPEETWTEWVELTALKPT